MLFRSFTSAYRAGEVIRIPIGHGDGRYVAPESLVALLEAEGRVVLRYVPLQGMDTPANPNGSVQDIAAICNSGGTVVGMMPHPERLAERVLGSDAGQGVFASLMQFRSAEVT